MKDSFARFLLIPLLTVLISVIIFTQTAKAAPTFSMIQITGVNNPRNVHAADMNGDGVKDIIGTAYGTADIYWWEYVAATNSFTPHLVADLFTGSYAVYGADLDGDEDMDIIATSANSPGAIRWWENLDDGTSFIEHSITEAFSGASSVQVMDIDGDEDL
ncbi:VCBS repeat-containing protein, partial [bacterium]